jgi:FKBP-type peptidyl-prolyl cis-trans isomerase 2
MERRFDMSGRCAVAGVVKKVKGSKVLVVYQDPVYGMVATYEVNVEEG